jgi:hypothetical protein
MSQKRALSKRFHPSIVEPIRVVPLRVPEIVGGPEVTAAAKPKLTYRNGPLIANAEVFAMYWGGGWQQSPASGLIAKLNKFFSDILGSALMDQMAEYSVSGYALGHGKFTGSITVTTPATGSSVDDSAIQSMIQNQIANNSTVPRPGHNTLYFVFLPPGVQVRQAGSASCQVFCGYHDSISPQNYYAVMPYPNCQGCTGGMDAFSALTVTSSHELCEAITDPVPGKGWYDDTNGEIGDICAWKTKTIGAYTVQQEWSNKAGSCI